MTTNIINSVIHTTRSQDLVRQIIPILVGWAKYGKTDKTYGDLLHALGYSHYSGIGTQLGNVEIVMRELRKETGEDIPTLNALVQKNGIPSGGFEFVYPNYNCLTLSEKQVFVAGINDSAVNYPKWNWVLDQLGLRPTKIFTEKELEHLSTNYGGGEGIEHKAIKEHIFEHPEHLDIKGVIRKETEHPLPSGDRLDVYFELSDGTHVAIEVKPRISPDQDIARGVFQCVKYYAVMDALRNIECKDYEIKVLLVTAGIFSSQNKVLAEELDVEYVEGFKYE